MQALRKHGLLFASRAYEKAGQLPGHSIPAKGGNQFEEFELEFEEEFELEFDEEFELELEDEFELLFEEELELELELLLDEELELLFDDEFELEFEEEFDSPRRLPFRSFLAFSAMVTKSVLPAFAVRSLAVPVGIAAVAGMMSDPAATAVAASKFVSFFI